MCVRLAVAMGLFRLIAECQDPNGVSAEELAKSSRGDKRLIGMHLLQSKISERPWILILFKSEQCGY